MDFRNIDKIIDETRERFNSEIIINHGTYGKFAKHCGMSETTIRGFFINNSGLSLEMFYRLCKIIDVSCEWALTGENRNKFSGKYITVDDILKMYNETSTENKKNKSLVGIIFNIQKKNQKKLSLKSIIEFSNYFNIKPYEIL